MIQLRKAETGRKSGKALASAAFRKREADGRASVPAFPSPPFSSSSTDVQDALPILATVCLLVFSYRWTFALAAVTWNDCQG